MSVDLPEVWPPSLTPPSKSYPLIGTDLQTLPKKEFMHTEYDRHPESQEGIQSRLLKTIRQDCIQTFYNGSF